MKTHVTLGEGGTGNGATPAFLDAVNQDGSLAFFETDESLVSGDTDSRFDIYQRSMTSGALTLISIGPNGGNGNTPNTHDVFFDGISADGSKVFFETGEKLVTGGGGDTDNDVDIYQRSGGTTTFITGGGGGDSVDAFFGGNSADGTHVFFETDESLDGGDSDSSTDVYDGTGGSQVLVSAGGNGAFTASYDGSSSDGTKVFFETFEALAGTGDSDSSRDIFQRASGTTTLVSGGSGAFNAFYDGASADGSRIFFGTPEALSGTGDSDSFDDTYQRTSGGLTLISTGTTTNGAFGSFFAGSSQDGTKVFFRTREKVESGDTDNQNDVYQRSGGTTTQISTGTNFNGDTVNDEAFFDGTSTDGSRVFWSTAEQVESGDTDSNTDVYERSGGTTTRLSTGSIGGNGAIPAFFEGSSADGTRVFLMTAEALASSDSDSADDIYERFGSTTTHISSGGNGPFNVLFVGTNESGRRAFIDTQEALLSSDTDSQIDVYANVNIPYEHPVGGSPIRVSLVPAFDGCSSTNSTHGAPLNFPSCSPPARSSSTARLGTGSIGFAQILACPVGAAPAACGQAGLVQPDVRFFANLRDVRCVGSVPAGCTAGGDYNPNGAAGPYTTVCTTAANCNTAAALASPYCAQSGSSSSACIAGTDVTLTATHPGAAAGSGLRITDIKNGSGQDLAATSASGSLPIPMDCLPSASSLGSTCGVNTSANALFPGAVRTGDSAVWEFGELQVLDSGPDGTRGNGDDQRVAVQGVFLP